MYWSTRVTGDAGVTRVHRGHWRHMSTVVTGNAEVTDHTGVTGDTEAQGRLEIHRGHMSSGVTGTAGVTGVRKSHSVTGGIDALGSLETPETLGKLEAETLKTYELGLGI